MSDPPIANLDEVDFDDVEENGRYTSRRACFSRSIGARDLGYNLTVLPPGKAQCPFHNHRGEEEMFLVLEGAGTLRFGELEYPIGPRDVIACPTGGPEVAHQIINTGAGELRFLGISTLHEPEVVEYPDSRKFAVRAGMTEGDPRSAQFSYLGRGGDPLGYWDDEG